MDRVPRVAVVLALVVGLLATGTSAGIGVVADPGGPADPSATGPAPTASTDPTPVAPGTGSEVAAGVTTSRDASPPADPATTAGSDPGTAPVREPVANETPHHLELGDGRIDSGVTRPTPDLAASLSAGDGEFKSVYVAYLARERLAEAETDGERAAAVRDIVSLVEGRVESLRGREATAVAAYHNGSIDRRELLRRLGSIDAEAGALGTALADIEERYPDVISSSLSFRFTTLNLDLESLEGPVRDRVGAALRSDGDPLRVRVTASQRGVAMGWIDDGSYVRETVRFDHYAPTASPEFSTSGAFDRLASRYPHTFPQVPDSLTSVGSRLFQVTWSYPQGTTTVYFDRSLGEVYRETQRLRLGQLPNGTVAVAARGEFRLVVNRTDGIDGVYRVSVYNATSGESRDVAVALGNERVERTGDDGVLWTLGTDRSFNVSATVEGVRLNTTVAPG